MRSTHCSTHPGQAAGWFCAACGVRLCERCLEKTGRRCPRCQQPPERLGQGADWNFPPDPGTALYPLRGWALALLAASGILGPALALPVLGIFVGLAVTVAVLHFGFQVLDRTARGNPADAPSFLQPHGPTLVRVVALLGALMAHGALGVASLVAAGPLALPPWALAWAVLLPATALVIGREEGLFAAMQAGLNPLRLAAVIRTIGRPILGTGLTLLLLAGATGLAVVLLMGRIPLWGLLALATPLATYTLVFAFRAAGELAAPHHRELGYVTRQRPKPPARPPKKPEPSRRERITELVREERLAEATELLRAEVADHPTDLNRWEQLYEVLRAREDNKPFLAGSRAFLTTLLGAGQEARALEVAQDALNVDEEFRPARPEQIRRLALAARRAGRPRLALRLMNRFSHHHPDHSDTPLVFLLSARILREDFRQTEQARQTLDHLLRLFPDHPASAEARKILADLGETS
ncbi:MAG: hypothetical protein ACLFRB_03485 [Thiohalorhabdus sp.]|uniref:hypothetical protein n=1 Tax=Thiohalorhabdus sp. TaxID=3094134 RepID=UPI00397FE827